MPAGLSASEGAPEPLGASLTDKGVNFAVWSSSATAVEVCLFDGESEVARIPLPGRTGPVFHGHVAGLKAGARYGLRAHGPFDPARGQRFNPNKLLVDPYALALDRPFALAPAMFGYRPDDPAGGASFDLTDSASAVPKAIVTTPEPVNPAPAFPWRKLVIYELHVRGFTKTHPDIPEAIRGTFAGLAHPAAIGHLKRLGVTAVEVLPCAAWIDERHLQALGLTNYWGYNPIAMMAPDPRLAPGGWPEVAAAVKALAEAGIETIVDVVFNHTGESNALGPTVSYRGLDNAGYYRLSPQDPARYVDDAGTGNILALDKPAPLRLALDALRAWRRFGGAAGFRFDLATVLGRRAEGFDPHAPLLSAIAQDPELREVKLIAEPWDCGPGGYRLGAFPPPWGEWNDKYRDTLRAFWRGDSCPLGRLASRLAGSQDLLPDRRPSRSINYVVAHDGFTLADLVSYSVKHNEANGEAGRDGTSDNISWNNGAEGPSRDPAIQQSRAADQRALLASLILSRGTPMLPMGAESGHSQQGNNNAYAQDNALGWLDWTTADPDLTAFAARLVALRQRHPALHADRFLTGEAGAHGPYPDVAWRRSDGAPMVGADWDDPSGETLAMLLAEPADGGFDRVMLVVHRGEEPVEIAVPEPRAGFGWQIGACTDDATRAGPVDGATTTAGPRSVLLLVETQAPRRKPREASPEALGQLAQAAGIAPDWWSLDGERYPVSPDTQRALLAALRLPADNSTAALETLHGLAQAADHRALPAVLVRRSDKPVQAPLRYTSAQPPPRTWVVVEGEDGEVHRLRADPLTCTETATRARDGRLVRSLVLDLPPLVAGRYRLRREDEPEAACELIVAPPTSFISPAVALGRRRLGASAQLYAVRRSGDQGLGDFTTLGALGEAAAAQGCAVLGINPLHALFPGERERASPYYPSDRRFLDPIYLDLAKVPGASPVPPGAAALSALSTIDYPAVWTLKARALEAAYAQGADDARLEAFIAAGGEPLRAFATFQAIAEQRPGEPWSRWPEDLRDPSRAQADPDRVRFHQYLQWLCEDQFEAAARRASGLDIGLCRDLAVGAAPDGAEAWALAGLTAPKVSIGAPPDFFAPHGQVWGLPPLDPRRIAQDGYATHAELFSANMRHAGALRIDHVMGLSRQFWVPEGAAGSDGAYVAFPFDDLLGVLALESAKAQCMVIGEDLGTVPHGLRESMAAQHILGYRVLPFERDGETFRPPESYPRLAWACVSTHDLPPLAGWWDGLDILERRDLGLSTPHAAQAELVAREAEKRRLLALLLERGLISETAAHAGVFTAEVSAGLHAFVAATPSVLAIAQVEDLAGERAAVNLPGTDRERPNWRRRMTTPLEAVFDSPLARAILTAMRAERPEAPRSADA